MISFTLNDKNIEIVGSILRTERTREIWKLLYNSKVPLCMTEIGKTIDNTNYPQTSVYVHHLNRMLETGIVTYTTKMNKGRMTKFYSVVSKISITPE